MLTKIYNNKIFRFLIAGGVAFLINLFLIYWFIDDLGFNIPLLKNVANVISIEISLIASFFIYLDFPRINILAMAKSLTEPELKP